MNDKTIVRGLIVCAAAAIVVAIVVGAWLLGMLLASVLLAVGAFRCGGGRGTV